MGPAGIAGLPERLDGVVVPGADPAFDLLDPQADNTSADDKNPAVQEFVNKFKAKYNEVPDDMAALGYDSAEILADAIKRAGGTDSEKLRDAIANTDAAGHTAVGVAAGGQEDETKQ